VEGKGVKIREGEGPIVEEYLIEGKEELIKRSYTVSANQTQEVSAQISHL
jgi:hypothetical protein